MPNRKHDTIVIRLTRRQYDVLHKNSQLNDVGVSSYARMLLRKKDQRCMQRIDTSGLVAVGKPLRSQGENLNSIARQINTYGLKRAFNQNLSDVIIPAMNMENRLLMKVNGEMTEIIRQYKTIGVDLTESTLGEDALVMAGDVYDKLLRIKVSKEMKQALVEEATGSNLTLSEYVRQVLSRDHGGAVYVIDMTPLRETLWELKKQGTNLSQIRTKLKQDGHELTEVLADVMNNERIVYSRLRSLLFVSRRGIKQHLLCAADVLEDRDTPEDGEEVNDK